MSKPRSVFVTYIASTPEKVWEALTRPEWTREFFFGRSVEIEPAVGGRFVLRMEDGRIDSKGRVLEWDPPRRLTVSWKVEWIESLRDLPEARIGFVLEPVGDAVRLTVIETYEAPVDDAILEGGRTGWPMILAGLKTLLETGRPLRLPVPEPPV